MAQYYIKDVIKSMLNMEQKTFDDVSVSQGSMSVLQSLKELSPSDDELDVIEKEKSTDSVGIRSPGGPMRGLSVKEFEDQLTTLKKENFNLKLRIYFLEERMGTNFNIDQGDAVKRNIELMVELESLRKEVQEKQDLLCQAVKAMELEEDEHRKDCERKDRELNDVKYQFNSLQQQYEIIQEEVRSQGDNLENRDFYGSTINEEAQETIKMLENKIVDLENQLYCERNTIVALNELAKCAESTSDTKELEDALCEKDEKIDELISELEDKNQEINEMNNKFDNTEVSYNESQSKLKFMEKELEQRKAKILDLEGEVRDLEAERNETKVLYEHEYKKNEKSKVAISHRNSKITELENQIEKLKVKNASLHLKLETAQNEVKSKTNDPRSPKHQKSINFDNNSFVVRSSPTAAEHSPKPLSRINPLSRTPNSSNKRSSQGQSGDEKALIVYCGETNTSNDLDQLQTDLENSRKRIQKLEHDQLKAVHIIQTMIEARKKNENEKAELQNTIQERENEIVELRNKCGPLQENDKKSLKSKISELNLTAAAPASDAEKTILDQDDGNQKILTEYSELVVELTNQKEIAMEILKNTEEELEHIKDKYNIVLEKLQRSENQVIDLEFEVLSAREDFNLNNREKSDPGSEKVSFWVNENIDKDKEIERLEKELSKKTSDLQGIVNKELWEKNREIEKLQKRINLIIEKKDLEINELKKDISAKNDQLQLLKEKISEIPINVKEATGTQYNDNTLQEKLMNSVKERKKLILEVADLKQKMIKLAEEDKQQRKDLEDELEKSEKLRVETNDVCSILSTRLEELAHFLDSLLKHKSVLGLLGHKQNTKIKTIIDQSLDLSKSLNFSMTMNPDQSLLQLSNISNLLNTTRNQTLNFEEFFETEKEDNSLSIMADHVTLTYQSHLNVGNTEKIQGEAIIKVLRNQIENLKREIEIRDNELGAKLVTNDQDLVNAIMEMDTSSRNLSSPRKIVKELMDENLKYQLTETQSEKIPLKSSPAVKCFENHSDSESWSEPDRSVSKARIGLDDQSLKPKHKIITLSESTELELKSKTPSKKVFNENRITINSLMQQIELLEEKLQFQEERLLAYQDMEMKYQEEKNKYQEEKKKFEDENKKFKEAVAVHEELISKIRTLEEKLAAVETKKMEVFKQMEDLRCTVKGYQKNKEILLENMDIKSKTVQNQINELECEKMQALESARHAEIALRTAQEEIEETKEKLQKMADQVVRVEENIRKCVEEEFSGKIENLEKNYNDKINKIQMDAEKKIHLISNEALALQKQYDSEYVKKNEMDRLLHMLHEVESLQDVLKISEEKVRILEESEVELKNKICNSEASFREKTQELRDDLDKATLQYSEAILEKTKILEENGILANELKNFNEKEKVFEKQVSDLKQEFGLLKSKFQKQVSGLETQKSKLQVKISELENTNADLWNKLIKLQVKKDSDQPFSAPTSPNSKILEMYLSKSNYKRQNSELSGGYASEGQVGSFMFRNNAEENSIQIEQERNSSPDLGIESDHGRFSSLEANVTTRPYIQSLELSQSMNVMLEQDKICSDECCKKMVLENNMLKDKLKYYNKLLQDTYSKLAIANQRKLEVEKNISKQIHKTSQVLRKAKANMETGSDSEVVLRK